MGTFLAVLGVLAFAALVVLAVRKSVKARAEQGSSGRGSAKNSADKK